MTPGTPQSEVGSVLRHWREHRHLTQLELALDAGISARHLSFVETGRSQPGREMLLQVLEQLEVPFREQNRLLLAAGHAPAYPERPLDDPDLAPVRDALDVILSGHDPYPAVAVDRVWNMVAANSAMFALTEAVNIDPQPEHEAASETATDEILGPVRVRTPDGGELSFFGMFASFDTPFEVTTSELAVEFLFPANQVTAEILHKRESGAPRR